jgi:hypothetical protein
MARPERPQACSLLGSRACSGSTGILLKGAGIDALWHEVVRRGGFVTELITVAVSRFHKTVD